MRIHQVILCLALATAPLTLSVAQRPGDEEQQQLDRANTALDRIYQSLLGALSPDEQQALKETERAWVKWRDLEADLSARLSTAGGSARRVAFSEAALKLVQERQQVLQGYLQDAKSR